MLVAALLFAALLTGNELGTLVAVHPAVRTLDVSGQVQVEQALTRRYLVVMPVLMTGTVVTTLVAGLGQHHTARTLLLSASAAYAVMLAITLAGNMVLNVATLRTDPTDATVDAWRSVRRRWDRLHAVRGALDLTGLVLVCVTATHPW